MKHTVVLDFYEDVDSVLNEEHADAIYTIAHFIPSPIYDRNAQLFRQYTTDPEQQGPDTYPVSESQIECLKSYEEVSDDFEQDLALWNEALKALWAKYDLYYDFVFVRTA